MRKTKGPSRAEYNPAEWDDAQSVHVTPEKRMHSDVSTSIRLSRDMVTKLRKVARRKGDIGYQTLLKIWIAERLEEELAKKRSA